MPPAIYNGTRLEQDIRPKVTQKAARTKIRMMEVIVRREANAALTEGEAYATRSDLTLEASIPANGSDIAAPDVDWTMFKSFFDSGGSPLRGEYFYYTTEISSRVVLDQNTCSDLIARMFEENKKNLVVLYVRDKAPILAGSQLDGTQLVNEGSIWLSLAGE